MQADVVGYSRLMESNELLTLERFKTHQQDFIKPTIHAYKGHIVKLMGDGILVEFSSVVDATSCAIAIQGGMADRNRDIPESEQILLRIGINLGDIIVEDDDIFGEGVNIAARLEGLATPGCICISGAVHDAIGNKLPLEYDFLGEQAVKNIEQPVRTYSARLADGAKLEAPRPITPQPGGSRSRTVLVVALVAAILAGLLLWLQPWQRDKLPPPADAVSKEPVLQPSIAVLPFKNMSGDVEQDYFSDGITEDIITDLSRLQGLAVIARNSSFIYKDTTAQIQEIGKDLGVAYILEGSIRKSGDRLRITAQLIDTGSSHQVWAERFDRELTDVFAMQDEITRQIVSALSIQLTGDEQQRLDHSAARNFTAYDLFLQGQRAAAEMSEEGMETAVNLYKKAISHDPELARAYGALAVTMTRQAYFGHSSSPVETSDRALELARKAVSIDPDSPQVLWALGYVYMIRKQFDEAITALERAIAIAPNYADGYGLLALINNNLGNATEAINLIEKGMQLNPHYTYDYPYNLGRAYYAIGNYEKAVQNLEKAVERNAAVYTPRLYLAASYVQLGRQDDAEWQVTELETLMPSSTISHWKKTISLADEEIRTRLFNDLSTAGMQE